VAVLVGLICLLIVIFSGGGSGAADKDMLACMPADIYELHAVMDFEKSKKFHFHPLKYSLEFDSGRAKIMGIDPDTISKSYWALSNKYGIVQVMRLTKAADKGKIASAISGKEDKAHGKTYLRGRFKGQPPSDVFISFPEDDLVFTADSEAHMKEVLGRKEGEIVLKDDMMEVIKNTARGQFWMIEQGPPSDPDCPFKRLDLPQGPWTGQWQEASIDSVVWGVVMMFDSPSGASRAAEQAPKLIEEKKRELDKLDLPAVMRKAKIEGLSTTSVGSSGKLLFLKGTFRTEAFFLWNK
jgi:hypothetical protein